MKNKIYLTQEGKEELENLIIGFKLKESSNVAQSDYKEASYYYAKVQILEKILSNSIILPIEEDWDNVGATKEQKLSKHYPNGVIIK